MNPRTIALAVRLLATACAGAALATTPGCPSPPCDGPPPGPIDVDTTADLLAVTGLDESLSSGLAVGANGTIVTWGSDSSDVFQIDPVTLRDVVATDTGWWVVGDGGTMTNSEDQGATWTPIDSGVSADLHAIALHDSTLVVVGDGVILVQASDGTWSNIAAPNGDWGLLRGVYSDGSHIYAVGLAGVAWSSTDPAGEWVAEDVETDVDLFDVGPHSAKTDQIMIVGAEGTLLLGDTTMGWTVKDIGATADLISCDGDGVLAANGQVYAIYYAGVVENVGTFTGARAVYRDSSWNITTVGDKGRVERHDYYECY